MILDGHVAVTAVPFAHSFGQGHDQVLSHVFFLKVC